MWCCFFVSQMRMVSHRELLWELKGMLKCATANDKTMLFVKHSIQCTSCRCSKTEKDLAFINKVLDLRAVKGLHRKSIKPSDNTCFPMWQLECRFTIRRIYTFVPRMECCYALITLFRLLSVMWVWEKRLCLTVYGCPPNSGWVFTRAF